MFHCLTIKQESTNQIILKRKRKMDSYLIANFVLSSIIIALNIFIFSIFTIGGSLLKKPSNRLLQSLSVGDLFSGVAVLWHCILQHMEMMGTDHSLGVRLAADVFTTFAVEAVVLHLCLITLDRCLSVFYALR